MMKAYTCRLGWLIVPGIVLWGQSVAQMVQADPQELLQQQQRRQELRSTVRQQQPGPVLNTAVAVPATPASAANANSPRRLSMEEKTELRRQLARDMRAQINK
jgi:hypothetical protein